MNVSELLRRLPSNVNSLLLTQAGRYWLEARLYDVRISEPSDTGDRNFFNWHARSARAWHYFTDGSGVMDGQPVADVGAELANMDYTSLAWIQLMRAERAFLGDVMGGETAAVNFFHQRGGFVAPGELQEAMEADDPALRD